MKTRRIKVSVTAKHIEKGKRRNPGYCPIALAIKGLGFKKVYVGRNYLILDKWPYKVPAKTNEFIRKFDENNDVKTFSFVAIKKACHKEI
jgi:hypothetical protein